jgi:hypothetical protein
MPIGAPRPETWIRTTAAGLNCEPGDFHIDPLRPVPRAVVTHGHGDHARPGNGRVLATAATTAIMRARYGEAAAGVLQPLAFRQSLAVGEVRVTLVRGRRGRRSTCRPWCRFRAGTNCADCATGRATTAAKGFC